MGRRAGVRARAVLAIALRLATTIGLAVWPHSASSDVSATAAFQYERNCSVHIKNVHVSNFPSKPEGMGFVADAFYFTFGKRSMSECRSVPYAPGIKDAGGFEVFPSWGAGCGIGVKKSS